MNGYSYFILYLFVVFVFSSCDRSDEELTAVELGFSRKSLSFEGQNRDYLLYVPNNYTGEEALPLVLSFHGLTENMDVQYNRSNLDELAEEENFILITPQGSSAFGVRFWTIDESTFAATNDIGFVKALMESVKNIYNIDSERVYALGMSNGGYFSLELACEMSEQIAAVASITGVMTNEQLNSCNATRTVPILQIHGTDDSIVPYAEVASVLELWIANNDLNQTPSENFQLSDTDTSNDRTVTYFLYGESDSDAPVVHYRVLNGGHEWFGAGQDKDIDASKVAWEFLSQFDLNGRMR